MKSPYGSDALRIEKKRDRLLSAGVRNNNITKGAYSYWCRQVMQAEGLRSKGTATAIPLMEPLLFAEVKTTEPIQLATLQVNWQDVSMKITSKQAVHLVVEMIASLRNLC